MLNRDPHLAAAQPSRKPSALDRGSNRAKKRPSILPSGSTPFDPLRTDATNNGRIFGVCLGVPWKTFVTR